VVPAGANSLEAKQIVVFTIGHSTHPIEEFISLLKLNEVNFLVDVRTIPRSRRNPQFNIEALPESLADVGIEYKHMASLGGLRRTRADSPNTGWRNESFRGYADYMQTAEFQKAINALIDLATHHQIAIMCAEAVPWRCHRSLIGDALLVRGIEVLEIISTAKPKPHKLTSFAHVEGETITYPPTEEHEGNIHPPNNPYS
jgi:uncharacterized protein (DUF488 family)